MAKKFDSDKPSIEEIMERRKPRTESAWVPIDGEVLRRVQELQQQIPLEEKRDERRTDGPPLAPQLRAELEDLEDAAAGSAVEFTFQALGRKRYAELISAHPPTDEDHEKVKAQHGVGRARWHWDTFIPELLAACAVSPEMDVDQARIIWDEWDAAVAEEIAGMAITVNEGVTKVPPFVRDSGKTRSSPQS